MYVSLELGWSLPDVLFSSPWGEVLMAVPISQMKLMSALELTLEGRVKRALVSTANEGGWKT